MLIRKTNLKQKKKKKKAQQFKTWPKTKGKINFGLGRKSLKFEKYIGFKLHLIYRITHVTPKMRYSIVMILEKPHRKMWY